MLRSLVLRARIAVVWHCKGLIHRETLYLYDKGGANPLLLWRIGIRTTVCDVEEFEHKLSFVFNFQILAELLDVEEQAW